MGEELLKPYNLNVISFTEPGIRPRNEDRFLHTALNEETHLLLVADGMGGYNDGDIAAEITIETIVKCLHATTDLSVIEAIELSFLKAHNAINQKLGNAGSTVGGVLITKEDIYLFWAGDIKIVLNNGGEVLTSKEHTLINLLRDAEITIKPEEVKRLTHTVVRSLGGKSNSFSPQIVQLKRCENFSGIICSDGLLEFYSDKELKSMFSKDALREFSSILDTGKYAHSADNISVILFNYFSI
jgi:protein phosphatase